MAKKFFPLKRFLAFQAALFGGMTIFEKVIEKKADKNIHRTDKGRYYNWRYGKVFFRTYGSGRTPVLLIHNASEYGSSFEWNRIVKELSSNEDFTLYTLDLPGCARSDKPAIEYTNYFYACLISSFIKDIIGSQTWVCASNCSSSFAVSAAALEESQYSGIIMINPVSPDETPHEAAGDGFSLPKIRGLRLLMSLPVLGTFLYYLSVSKRSLDFLLKERSFYNPFSIDRKIPEAFYEAAHMDNGKVRYLKASILCGYLKWNIRHLFERLSIPVYILYGSRYGDGKRAALAYRSSNPDIAITEIPESKALPQLENPGYTADAILQIILKQ